MHLLDATVCDQPHATDAGVTVPSTEINPGFAMDAFSAVVSTPCRAVATIRVEGIQDAAQRRAPL